MFFQNIKKFLFVLEKRERNYFFIFSFLLVLAALLEFLSIGLVIPFTMLITDSSILLENRIIKEYFPIIKDIKESSLIIILLITFIIVFFLKFLFFIILTISKNRFLFSVKEKLQSELFCSYILKPYQFHINTHSSVLINNLTNNINLLVLYACQGILELISEIVLSLFLISLLIIYEPKGALFVLLVSSIFIYFFFKYSKNRSQNIGKKRKLLDQEVMKGIQQSFNGIKEVLIYQKQFEFMKIFQLKVKDLTKLEAKFTNMIEFPRHVLEFLAVACFVLLITYLFHQETSKSQIVTILSLFAAATFKLIPSLNRMVVAYSKIRYNFAIIEQIVPDLEDYKKNYLSTKIHVGNEKLDFQFNDKIEIQNINFSFGPKKIFENASAYFNKGEIIGILGESGSGKSTLINIISGLIYPQSGEIIVDGKNILSNKEGWLSNISYIPQHVYMLDDSIKKNVVFFDSDEIDTNRLVKALIDAQLDNFVNNLPNKIDEVIGERGSKLSGGQIQRLALARAFYKGSNIMILDEATNALDEKNENKILQLLSSLKNKKLIILISHSKNSLKICDRVYSISDNKLIV